MGNYINAFFSPWLIMVMPVDFIIFRLRTAIRALRDDDKVRAA